MERSSLDQATLLSVPDIETFSIEDRAEALKLAKHKGMTAVERVSSSNRDNLSRPYLDVVQPEMLLCSPNRAEYYQKVIGPAARDGKIEETTEDWWRDFLSGQTAEDESRVAQFLAGWRERAGEIINWQRKNGIRGEFV